MNLDPAEFEAWGSVWHLCDAVAIQPSGAMRTRFSVFALALYWAAGIPAEEGTTRHRTLTEYFAA